MGASDRGPDLRLRNAYVLRASAIYAGRATSVGGLESTLVRVRLSPRAVLFIDRDRATLRELVGSAGHVGGGQRSCFGSGSVLDQGIHVLFAKTPGRSEERRPRDEEVAFGSGQGGSLGPVVELEQRRACVHEVALLHEDAPDTSGYRGTNLRLAIEGLDHAVSSDVPRCRQRLADVNTAIDDGVARRLRDIARAHLVGRARSHIPNEEE
jgi:hypothetical protein